MLLEHFPDLTAGRVRLICSDISQTVLSRAQHGSYNLVEIKRGLDLELREKYFERRGDNWHITPRIRTQIDFRQINLIDQWPLLPLMDIILMRNVLLYFSDKTKQLIIEKTKSQLKRGGYLFLGVTEAPGMVDSGLENMRYGRTMCFRSKF